MASYYMGLSLLSNKQQKAVAHRKLLHTEARRILSLLNGCPLDKPDIAKEENGRPFFRDRRADFNISHSGNMAAVSLVKPFTGDEGIHDSAMMIRTGCDIELVRDRANVRKVAEKFFSPAERDYVFGRDQALNETRDESLGKSRDLNQYDMARFFHIWTLKECFLKLKGLSVFDMAKTPPFIYTDSGGRSQFAFCAPSPVSFSLYELSGPSERYVLASAIEGAGQLPLGLQLRLQPEIRWFSESSLPCRSIVEIKAAPSPPETVSAKM